MENLKISIETNSPIALNTIGNALIQISHDESIIVTSSPTPSPINGTEVLFTSSPTPSPINGTEVDNTGLPWDRRIHSTGKTMNKDGSWKLLKKPKQYADDADGWKSFIASVVAELNGETNVTVTGDGTGETLPVIEEDTATQASNAGFGEQVAEPTTNAQPVFNDLMKLITSNGDKVHIDQVTDICKKFGQADLSAINVSDNAALIPIIFDEVQALIAAIK